MMTKEKLADLQTEGQKYIADARELAEKHDGTDLSEWPEAERDEYNEAMAKAADVIPRIKTARADLEIWDQAKAISAEIGLPVLGGHDPVAAAVRWPIKSLGRTITEAPEFKSMLAPFTHDGQISIPKGTHINSAPIQIKSLFTGSADSSGGAFITPDRTDIVEMLGRRPLGLENLVSSRTTTSDVVEYVEQVSHTNAAATVPEATSSATPTVSGANLVPAVGGGYKPEGAWAFAVRQATVKTVAEWVPATKRALADVGQLEGLINDELQKDLAEVREDQLLNGDGLGENLLGITKVSGIQTQAAVAGDLFASIRKGITKLRTVGRSNPTGIVINPIDAETIDLTKDLQGRYYYGGPQGIDAKTLWGLPIVESEFQAAGKALVGDFSKAVVWDRQQSTVTMTDSHADFFVRNLVAVLAEERLAFAVIRPLAFNLVTL